MSNVTYLYRNCQGIPADPPYYDGPFGPMDLAWVQISALWGELSDLERMLRLSLCCHAWERENPRGSLPGNPHLIADLLGVPREKFSRERIMAGWEKHSDGRYYHPSFTERVIEFRRRLDKERERYRRSKRKIRGAERQKRLKVLREKERREGKVPKTIVDEVFEHWKSVMNHPTAKLGDKRPKIIRRALEWGYSKEDLIRAIDGCKLTPFNMGKNDRFQVFDSLELILRNTAQIDRFMANAAKPPARDKFEAARDHSGPEWDWMRRKEGDQC